MTRGSGREWHGDSFFPPIFGYASTNSSLVILNLFWWFLCFSYLSYRAQAALGAMAVLLVTLSSEKTDTSDHLLMMFFNHILNLPPCCSNDSYQLCISSCIPLTGSSEQERGCAVQITGREKTRKKLRNWMMKMTMLMMLWVALRGTTGPY